MEYSFRSVNTHETFERVVQLNQKHHFSLIALMEPFTNRTRIEAFRRRLGMEQAFVNANGQIWVFVDCNYVVEEIQNNDQHLALKLYHQHRSR